MSDLLLPSLCPCPGAKVGPPPRASLPSGLWSVSQKGRLELGWERGGGCPPLGPFRLPQAGLHWRSLLWRWPLCPLSLLHLCVLATASFSSPKGEGRSGSLAFTSLGCTCGFHTSLSCCWQLEWQHLEWHPPHVILIWVSSTLQGSWLIVSLLKRQSTFRSREGTCRLKLNLRALDP